MTKKKWIERERMDNGPARKPGPVRFLFRYPIFLLVFGPPLFRGTVYGNTSQAHFDIWNVFQVAWLGAVALPATMRLVSNKKILLTRHSRSVFTCLLALGGLFAVSVLYSPGKAVSAECCVLYFATVVCMIEFVVDVYNNPPDWMQCMFELRLVGIILYVVALLCIPIQPAWVIDVSSDFGVRLEGGSVCEFAIILPVIAVISAYSFLHKLESRPKAAFLFLFAMAGVLAGQTRGVDLALSPVLAALAIAWGKRSGRGASILASGLMIGILVIGVLLTIVGPGAVWNKFNRGDASSLYTASGRVENMRDIVVYMASHPWGMGYIAGVRTMQFGTHKDDLHMLLNSNGGTDNSYMETLTDAGWLSLGLYLLIIGKVFGIVWNLANKRGAARYGDPGLHHAMQCALLLFSYCLIEAMEGPSFVVPRNQEYYVQNVLIAVILGASTTVTLAWRARQKSSVVNAVAGQGLALSS